MPRKTHVKKDEMAAQVFKGELSSKLAKLELGNVGAVRIWVADEHRYGLISIVRRCWSLKGVRAKAHYHTKYQWGYLYSALEVDGKNSSEALFTNSVNLETSARFLEQIAQSDPKAEHVIIWDRAGFHPVENHPMVPSNVHLLPLPAYSPELNPVEKIGSFIKDATANRAWNTLCEIETAISEELRPIWENPSRVASLIGDNWLTAQVNFFARQE